MLDGQVQSKFEQAKMWGGSGWGKYCKDPAFADFGDESVIFDDGTVSWQSPGGAPGVDVPFGNSSNRQCGVNVSSHPPCEDTVDLQVPLKACTRKSIGQRVDALGHGAIHPWWRTCGSTCKPLPKASFHTEDARSGFGDGTTGHFFGGRAASTTQ